MNDPHQQEERPATAAPLKYQPTNEERMTRTEASVNPQRAGLVLHLADAEARVRQAELVGYYVQAREARRVAHRLKRKLRPTPVPVARWLPIGDVIRQATGR